MKGPIYAALVAAFLLSGCSDTPTERQYVDLSGTWHTELGDINLPGTTDEAHLGDSLRTHDETGRLSRRFPLCRPVTYTREVDIPKDMEGQHIQLFIEKTKPSTLFVDGDSIGSIGLLHAPHIYDISNIGTGRHTLSVRVDNTPHAILPAIGGSHAVTDATQTNWNGLLGRIAIEAMPLTYIENMFIDAVPDTTLITTHENAAPTAHANVIVTLIIESQTEGDVTIRTRCTQANATHSSGEVRSQGNSTLKKGRNVVSVPFEIENASLWSEFEQPLYDLTVDLFSEDGNDTKTDRFGVRTFSTRDGQFVINGKTTFLRGKHDACVFPLTAYAPMDKEEWIRIFNIAKSYGINHYRFHSWTPPAAAFEAADETGIYLQPELPFWGSIEPDSVSEDSKKLNDFLRKEARTIIRAFGNHPSFVMMALGNELWGDTATMHNWVNELRAHDSRRLYAFGSNNFLGWYGPLEGEDFMVTCRVGGEETGKYNTHVRASFSYADAADGGIINGTYPNTRMTFTEAASKSPVPVVGHETCQFQIYPDFDEIDKYRGVLRPDNLRAFRRGLEPNMLDNMPKRFHKASGALAAICYKADIEMCIRSRHFGGFQMLDLQDYPGQGSALVGILDAFMESKGIISAEKFHGFCSSVVPLALMDKMTYSSDETFKADVAIANYSASDFTTPLRWTLRADSADAAFAEGNISKTAKQGDVTTVGDISVELNKIETPSHLKLTLTAGSAANDYDIWVYPTVKKEEKVKVITSVTPKTIAQIAKGQTAIICPNHKDIENQSVGGMFMTDYWNYAMFKTISENVGKPVSPGTLGYLINDESALFKTFPTESYTDYQWWAISKASRPLILDGTPPELEPIVMAIDNVNRNHKLGVVFEVKIGEGKALVCMTDLDAIAEYPEGQQFAAALQEYASSEDFDPSYSMTADEFCKLFTRDISVRDIRGVRNITDYKKKE